jgi:hypothetical protein
MRKDNRYCGDKAQCIEIILSRHNSHLAMGDRLDQRRSEGRRVLAITPARARPAPLRPSNLTNW